MNEDFSELDRLASKAAEAIRTIYSKNKNALKTALTQSDLEIRKGAAIVALVTVIRAFEDNREGKVQWQGIVLDSLEFALKIESDIRQRALLQKVIDQVKEIV